MTAGAGISDGDRLYALVAAEDLQGFLDGVCAAAAEMMYRVTGTWTETVITLNRPKRSTLLAGNSPNASRLGDSVRLLCQGSGTDGPGGGIQTFVVDSRAGFPWRGHKRDLPGAESGSVLGIALHLGAEASGGLGFCAPSPGVFGDGVVAEAVTFADTASGAMLVALRVAAAEELATHLRAALESRTAIDVACGMIMAENRCSKDQAFDILCHASNHRNEKIAFIAQELITRTAGLTVTTTHFDD